MKEVVGQADAIEAQQLRDEFAEQKLFGRARGEVPGRQPGALGRGQRLAIELAVGCERQRIEHHERRRQHGLRQARARRWRRLGDRSAALPCASLRHQVSDQALFACRVLASDHRRLRDVRLAQQSGLDFAGLDAEAANLELLSARPWKSRLPSSRHEARSPVR